MQRIMIIEDDRVIAREVLTRLGVWGFETRAVENFREVLAEFQDFSPHLVLLDIGLPCYDGYYWCSEIRKTSKVPVIFLSSASDNMNIVMAMHMGADDFISKPFDMTVLIAKVQALLRRTYDFAVEAPILEHRGAVLNTGSQSLIYGGEQISLTKNEYRIMLTLLTDKGKVVSREKLMEALWKTDSFVDENTLTVNVNRLRKKLDAGGLEDYIETKVGVGYGIF